MVLITTSEKEREAVSALEMSHLLAIHRPEFQGVAYSNGALVAERYEIPT